MDISEPDVLAAMKAMQGYIDITPADFRAIYRAAYTLAKERMLSALTAGAIMAQPVHTIAVGDDLIAAATLLAEKGISGAPVIDGQGCIVGVISEKDFLRRMGAGPGGSFMQVIALCLKNKGCLATAMINRTAGDLMSVPPITARADVSMGAVAALLRDKNINRLPIVDPDGRPVGIVTRTDLVNAFCMLG
jgi:CBS-domain-containing membrane protein